MKKGLYAYSIVNIELHVLPDAAQFAVKSACVGVGAFCPPPYLGCDVNFKRLDYYRITFFIYVIYVIWTKNIPELNAPKKIIIFGSFKDSLRK